MHKKVGTSWVSRKEGGGYDPLTNYANIAYMFSEILTEFNQVKTYMKLLKI